MLRLEVEVGKPERVGDYRTGFVMFPVITKLAELPKYKKERTSLARCVSDFLAFRQTLLNEFPHLIIPSLAPEYQIDMFHKLSEAVLEKRREELETFLHRLISIPDIKVSDSLLAFLQSPQWTATVKARSDDMFSDLMKKLTNETGALVGKFIGDSFESSGSQFNALMAYVNDFNETLTGITQLASVLLRCQQDMGCDYQKLGASLSKFGRMETNLQGLILHLSSSMMSIGTIYLDQAFIENGGIMQSLKQYIELSKTLQDVLKHRSKLVNEYYGVFMEIRDSKVELSRLQDQLINNPAPQRGTTLQYFNYLVEDPFSKVQKLQTKIDKAEIELVQKREKMTEASDKIMQQIAQFEEWKQNDFKRMFLQYIQNQIDFHAKAKKAWQSVLSNIVATSIANPTPTPPLRSPKIARASPKLTHINHVNHVIDPVASTSHQEEEEDAELDGALSASTVLLPPSLTGAGGAGGSADNKLSSDLLDDDNVVDQDYLSTTNSEVVAAALNIPEPDYVL